MPDKKKNKIKRRKDAVLNYSSVLDVLLSLDRILVQTGFVFYHYYYYYYYYYLYPFEEYFSDIGPIVHKR